MNSTDADIAIIAPTGDEWLGMIAQLADVIDSSEFPLPAKTGRIGNHSVLCCATGKGQEETASAATMILERTKPALVLLVGIAGGFPQQGVSRGDVIVAHAIHSFDYGKLVAGDFKRRPENDINCDRRLLAFAEIAAGGNSHEWRQAVQERRPDGKASEQFRVHLDCYVASSNKVVDDPDHAFYSTVARAFPEIHGVEMEGIGAGASARLAQSERAVGFLMIRGISDEPGNPGSGKEQRSLWKRYAIATAAAFARRVIEALPDLRSLDKEEPSLGTLESSTSTNGPSNVTSESILRTTKKQHLFDDVPAYFQNRDEEQLRIHSFLRHQSLRLLRLVGSSGNGKTTLVHRALNELTKDLDNPLEISLIELNAAEPDGVSVYSLLEKLKAAFPSNSLRITDDGVESDLDVQLQELLSALRHERIVIFIDEFERLVDEASRAIKADAKLLLSTVLTQIRSPVKIILATFLEPNDLASIVPSLQERLVVKPLTSPHGENLLRSRDADGEVGLNKAPSELLKRACERLDWSPRELEWLYWDLAAHLSTSLEEWLDSSDWREHRNNSEFFVQRIFSLLSPETQKVAQTLAIYGRPIEAEGVAHMLLPYGFGENVRQSLNLLVDMGIARRKSLRYYLQPLQNAYILSQIPALSSRLSGELGMSYSRNALYISGAGYFEAIRMRSEEGAGLRSDFLNAALDEFELRCAGGDYENAAKLLLAVDYEALVVPGRFGRLVELHELLLGRLQDPILRMNSLKNLGVGYYRTGRSADATNSFQMALAIAINRDEKREAMIRCNLGNCYSELGRTFNAIQSYSEALAIADRSQDDCSRATYLQCLGNRYSDLGDSTQAHSHYAAALKLYDHLLSLGTTNRANASKGDAISLNEERALLLSNIAELHIDEGSFDQSIKAAQAGRSIGEEIGSSLAQCAAYCVIATANLYLGVLNIARNEIDLAQQFDIPQLNHEVLARSGLISFLQGNIEAAKRNFLRSVEYAVTLSTLNPSNHQILYCTTVSECGLVFCGSAEHARHARAAYRAARKINSDPGVVRRFHSLLRLLSRARPTITFRVEEDQLGFSANM